MIRQAISCDICGAEKKQTNHWFVVYEQAGELRVSGWSSRNRLKADAKHLCGQACLHKLADDFMARVIGEKAARSQPVAEEMAVEPAATKRAEARSGAAVAGHAPATGRPIAQIRPARQEISAARLRPAARTAARGDSTPDPDVVRNADLEFDRQVDPEAESSARLIASAKPVLLPQPARPATTLVPMPEPVPLPAEPPRYASRHWHTEAWERERERSLRSGGDPRSEHASRRFSQA